MRSEMTARAAAGGETDWWSAWRAWTGGDIARGRDGVQSRSGRTLGRAPKAALAAVVAAVVPAVVPAVAVETAPRDGPLQPCRSPQVPLNVYKYRNVANVNFFFSRREII